MTLIGALAAPASFGAQLPAQTMSGVESPYFRIVFPERAARTAESILARLENLRHSLIQLHGPAWVPARPVVVYLPASTAEFRRFTGNPLETGLYRNSARYDWLAADPGSPHLLQVLSHEYIHAVLGKRFPDLEEPLTEGLCEFYSTLATEPGRLRLLPLPHRLAELASRGSANSPYALAWAKTYHYFAVRGTSLAEPPEPARLAAAKLPFAFAPLPLEAPNRTPLPPFALRALAPPLVRDLTQQALALFAPATPAASEAEATFLAGLRKLDDGNPALALPLLEQATRARPTQSSWWLTLAQAYFEAKRNEEARVTAGQALESAATATERQAAQAFLERLQR